jgi:hypothetical protein
MPARKFAALAAMVVLLTVTTPARAAYVYEDINVNFANGFQATGELTLYGSFGPGGGFGPSCGASSILPCSVPTLTGGPGWMPFGLSAGFDYEYIHLLPYVPPPCPSGFSCGHPGIGPHLTEFLQIACCGILPESFSDFALTGDFPASAVSGTVSSVSPVPLPDALPMFGAALFALGGFAARRSRGRFSP